MMNNNNNKKKSNKTYLKLDQQKIMKWVTNEENDMDNKKVEKIETNIRELIKTQQIKMKERKKIGKKEI